MEFVVEIPEELARRIVAVANRRGMRPEDLAIEAVADCFPARADDRLPVPDTDQDRVDADDALDAFIGCGGSGGVHLERDNSRLSQRSNQSPSASES